MKMMMIVLLLLISQHASGVEVYEGAESILLPCRVPVDVSRNSTSALWDREELSDATVHLRRQKSDDLDERDSLSGQNKLYKHRTSMRVDALQTGDLSLTLRNPTVSDSGTYTCITRKAGEDLSKTGVHLKVSEPPPVWPKVLIAVLVTPIILAAVCGLFVYCAYIKKKDREALQPQVVKVPQGKESVLLPFKTTADLREAVKVEWRLTEPKLVMVHMYGSENSHTVKQEQVYIGRTEMNEDPLNTKDLSLTLKDLNLTDSGVYTCIVYNKDGHMLLQKSVTLSITVPQPELVNATDADESVLLPFKTTADLPQNVTVEWRDSKNTKVHVYESGNNQPDKQHQDYRGRTEMDEDRLRNKDFSLTLKDLHLTDSGVYTCTVCNKDGHMLLRKSVTLRVREILPDIVHVQKSQRWIKLPFKITADLPQDVTVEWRRSDNNMKVHVYESANQLDKQHQDYRGHTKMDEDPLTNKDLSLTLNKIDLSDTGVYTCTVYNKIGDMLLQKSVSLSVTVSGMTKIMTLCGEKTVTLEFKKKVSEVSTVEWKLIYPKYKLIQKKYVKMGNNTEKDEDPLRTKDLSLSLDDPHPTDSGVYTCTVYNKDGHITEQKSLLLNVIDFLVEVVDVTEGEESVLLPFETTTDLRHVSKVEWRLIEPKSVKVHVYESGNNQPDKQQTANNKQHQDYRGRTEMNKNPLRTGDLSLTLKDLHLTDSGVYTCTVYNKDGHMLLQKVVTLRVRALQTEVVEVPQWKKSVLLPFKTTADLPQDITVEWRDSNKMKIHVYESGNNQPDKQDQDNKDLTEMNEDPLTTKDLSLTLKDLHLTDSEVYTCTVYNKDGKKLLQKSVILIVRDTVRRLWTVFGNKSYLLEFDKTDKLDQISKVEWERIYPEYKLMKKITRRQGNGEDLSLNLEDLRLSDSGIYTCTAYGHNEDNNDEVILLRQFVTFNIIDFQLEKVEVTEGEESVLLPFKTTADLHHVVTVQWTLTEDPLKIVHVYEVPDGKKRAPSLDPPYRGRTEMNKDPLRTGDLSLTLKKPLPTDSRSYTCTVLHEDGRTLVRKVVTLRVRATLKGTMEDMLPCLRRRRAPNAEVKEDVRNMNQEQEPLTAEETV